MLCEEYFIVYLDKGETMTPDSQFTLCSNEKSLLFVRCKKKQRDLHISDNNNIIPIPRECLTLFIKSLGVDIFSIYPPKKPPEYISLPCPKGAFPRAVILELVTNTSASNIDIKTSQTQFLKMALMSIFLDHKMFLPLLRHSIRRNIREQVMLIITSDIRYKWSIEKVAGKLFISPSLLKKKLRSEKTKYSYIVLECRMQRASELILDRDLPVNKIAEKCGYSSTPYFISVFRKFYGCTPLEYRHYECILSPNRN